MLGSQRCRGRGRVQVKDPEATMKRMYESMVRAPPEEFRGFLKGNVLKYMWRERMKGGTESLEKAQWYLTQLVDNEKTST